MDVTIKTIRKITEVWNDSIWNEELIRSDNEVGMKKWVSTLHTSIKVEGVLLLIPEVSDSFRIDTAKCYSDY